MGLGMQRCRREGTPIVYHVDKTEGAPWVLLLHGAFVDHRMFRTQVEAFRGRYSVIAVDILGHGGSTETHRGDSLESMASWLSAILEAEGASTAHVVGVSLGGVLAQDFACAYPEHVASLACFGACDITRPDPELIEANGAAQMAMVGKALVSVRWFAEADRLFRPTLTRRKRSSTSSIWVSQAIAAASGGLGKNKNALRRGRLL